MGLSVNGGYNNTPPNNMGSGNQFTREEIIDYLMSKGISREGAIGIVANLEAESGLTTDATGSQGEVGLAQWKGPRLDALKAYAQENGLDWRSKDAQLGFLYHELSTEHPELLSKLENATDPAQAAADFCAEYEIPTLDNGTPNYATYDERRRMAMQINSGDIR